MDIEGELAAFEAAQQDEREAVADARIAGALFDFCGYLSTLETPVTFSAYHEATPAVDALAAWAKKRGLALEPADVGGWNAAQSAESAESGEEPGQVAD